MQDQINAKRTEIIDAKIAAGKANALVQKLDNELTELYLLQEKATLENNV